MVRALNMAELSAFLKSVSISQPIFDWKAFNITAKTLGFDKLAGTNIKPWQKELQKYYTDSIVRIAIEGLQKMGWTDDRPFCAVYIIKNNNDTVKVTSNRQVSCMLPWQVNGTDSYDIGISRFFASVLDDNELSVSNKARVSGIYLPSEIQEYVTRRYTRKIIDKGNFFYEHPENLALLQSHFKITYTGNDNGGDRCILTSDALPVNASMPALIRIDNKQSIERLIRHRDSVASAIKLGNFVFNYYSNIKDARLSFPWDYQFNTTSFIVADFVCKQLPVLLKYNLNKAIFFRINAEGTQSEWLLLPDNKLVLLSHYGDKIANIPLQILGKQLNGGGMERSDAVFMEFDTDGRMLAVTRQ